MRTRLLLRRAFLAGLTLALFVPARAERLPFKSYTTADGLARDHVAGIFQDSRGFIWFCTAEGLSRFDGYSFTNFGKEDGLPGPAVSDMLEASDGAYWLATDEGLARLDPAARGTLFRSFQLPGGGSANQVRTLLETRDGSILAGTAGGLFRFHPGTETFDQIDLGDTRPEGILQVNDLLEDADGTLWIATRFVGLIRRHADGRIESYLTPVIQPKGNIRAIAFDGKGGLWAGGFDGLTHLTPGPEPGRLVAGERYTEADGLLSNQVYAMLHTSDDRLVAATTYGATVLSSVEGARPRITTWSTRQGLSLVKAIAVAEDRSGNLWFGSDGAGVWKLARDGFTAFTAGETLPGPLVVSFVQDRKGRLYSSTHTVGLETILNPLEAVPLPGIRINIPSRIHGRGWGTSQLTLQDRHGDWWVPTGQGLVRFTGVDKAEDLATVIPSAVYTEKDGVPNSEIYRIFEDSRGDIWVSAYGLARYDRATGRFQRLGGDGPSALGEDGGGNVWLGFWGGGLSRYRDGRFERFNAQDGVPEGLIGWIMRDSRNRLWIGSTEGGVARVDDPTAVKPTFVRYTMAQGLSSSQVNCVTEDRWGRIYLGTGRGLDVLEPDTGRIRHFTTADGLAGSGVLQAAGDRSGGLWFATQSGVSKLVPRAPEPRKPPAVFISELSIAGVRRPINLLGEAALEGLVLSADQRQIEIGFVGLDFSAGERLRYQYRLEGAGTDWSPPTDRRSVNYAHLSPGRYRFAVRALDSDGQGSLVPSSMTFSIMKPVWQRGWFLAMSVAALIALSYAFYQYRLKQALRLERVRTHIATDLHDDIGASLSQIAILNEVALQRLQSGAGVPGGMLAAAAQSAREVVDAMSDVVWAVDPKKDRLEDLVLRMRRFAEELCAARGIELRFDATPDGARRLDAQSRRQIYLLFKESLNNAVKHSGCAVIDAKLRIQASRLELDIADDGGGFDPLAGHEGQGLSSMRRRAEALGGEMVIRSGRSEGTQVHFSIPA